jgi:uncharacterized membrane protein required for colicin V production
MIDVAILLILFFCIAFIFNEGLWSACLLLINVLLAGIISVNFFEPLATWFEKMMPGFTYFWDFLALWLIFSIAIVALRLLTGLLSKHRLRFKKPVDTAGGVFFGACVGWVMMQFTLFSFHLAPLSRNFLGFQEKPDSRMVIGLAPDRTWLSMMKTLSGGSLSRGSEGSEHLFNPDEDFIIKYGTRRKNYENETSMTVKS